MWLHEGEEYDGKDIDKYYGFIYLITNLETGRKYIGRKFFTKAKTKQVNGKRKKLRVESDWTDYYGSSEELQADIALLGKEKFKREIIRLCSSLGECKYWETKLQFINNVLEEKLEDDSWAWYNGNIAMKYTRRNIGKF